jgi:hypothetical protein
VIESGGCVGNIVKLIFSEGFATEKAINSHFPIISRLWTKELVDFLGNIVDCSDLDCILFSAESMSNLDIDILQYLKQRLAVQYDCEFIFFVRDYYDHFHSAWTQSLKSRYIKSDFYSLVRDTVNGKKKNKGMFTAVINYSNAGIVLKVINYDTCKSNLANEFMRVSRISFNNALPAEGVGNIFNRSLSPSEARIQLMINRHFSGTQLPAFVCSRLLARQLPAQAFQRSYDPAIDQMLLDHFGEWISKINEAIHGQPLRNQLRSDTPSKAPLKVDVADLECCLAALELAFRKQQERMSITRRLAHLWKCVFLKHVPHDFDPEAYLSMNQDVASAKVDPYIHYSRNGYLEGRAYRYF